MTPSFSSGRCASYSSSTLPVSAPVMVVKTALLAINAPVLAALFQLRNPIGARHDTQR